MAAPRDKELDIPVEDLMLDLENPRFNGLTDQRQALHSLCNKELSKKLMRLAEDIAAEGLNPTERPIVVQALDDTNYIVLEGNRRLAAIKLLCEPNRIDETPLAASQKKRFRELASKFDLGLVDPLSCVVMESREEANHWIELRHTGENAGAGIVPWDGQATARFRGREPGLQVLEYVRKHGKMPHDVRNALDRFPLTNLDRLLGDPDVRNSLGVELRSGKVISRCSSEDTVKTLLRVVTDIAKKNITVSDIKRKEDRKRYLDSIKKDFPTKSSNSSWVMQS